MIKNRFRSNTILFAFGISICFASYAVAYDDIITHPDITERAARESNLKNYLVNNLGIVEGLDKSLEYNGKSLKIFEWLRKGSTDEDSPICRASNHFHNPLKSWEQSGVSDQPSLISGWCSLTGYSTKYSNATWATGYLSPAPNGSKITISGQEMGWDNAREYYHLALTSQSSADRETNFAMTFQSLGQVIHLIEDMAVPAHVRNDFSAHVYFQDAGFRSPTTWFGNSFEWYVKQNPSLVTGSEIVQIDFTNAGITRFWDTDVYDGSSRLIDTSLGLTEYTNANFFSDYTIFAESKDPQDVHYFPLPAESDTNAYLIEQEAEDGTIDKVYYVKLDGEDYRLAAYSYFHLWKNLLPYWGWAYGLDDEVHKDYAQELLPRAVGYSAGLLNYFFRGEIGIGHMSHSKSITITNLSSEKMVGTFRLYYDAADGTRKSIQDDSWSMPLEAGETTIEYTYTEPKDLGEERRYIMVFKGQLGNESEAVVGKIWNDKEKELLVYIKSIEVSAPFFLVNFGSGFCHGGTFNYLSLSPEQVEVEFEVDWGGSISSYFTKLTYELGILGKDVSEISSINFSGVAGMFRTGNYAYCQNLHEEIYQTITVNIGQNIWSTTSSEADYPKEIYGRTKANVIISISFSDGEQVDFTLTDDHAPTYKKLCELPMAECANRDHIAVLETHFNFLSSPIVLHNNGFDLEPDFTFEIGGYSENTRQDFGTESYPCEDDDGNVVGLLNVLSGEELIVDGPSLTKGITKTYPWYQGEFPDTLTTSPPILTKGYIEKITTNGDAIKTSYIVNTPY